MNVQCYYIKPQYFLDNSNFVNMLDLGDVAKQAHRTYVCVKVSIDNNDYFIPLRSNLGMEVRPFGRIGHSVPSYSRPNAGLDYRYALIIKNMDYLEVPNGWSIPDSQVEKIESDFSKIEQEFETYLKGFIKALKKNRISREPLYRVSSLQNFTDCFS